MPEPKQQTQSERLGYTLQHNSWNAPEDKIKLRIFREMYELSLRLENLESRNVPK